MAEVINKVSALTDAIVKSKYEANADTNALTDMLLSKLNGIESAATADQSDAEIETAYNNQVSVVSQAEAEAGTATTVRRWTAERVKQAIVALGAAGSTPTEIQNTKAMIIANPGTAAYVAPASLGNAGVLTIDSWADFKSASILVKQSEDYDNSTNDFVLQIVDSSGNSNTWDASDDDPAFDLVIPQIKVWDAGPAVLGSDELATYGIAETPFDNAPNNAISWASSTLSIRFSGADLKGKSWNVITISK